MLDYGHVSESECVLWKFSLDTSLSLLTKFIIDNVHVIVVVETGARRVNIRYNQFISKLVGCWYFLKFANHFTQFRKKYDE